MTLDLGALVREQYEAIPPDFKCDHWRVSGLERELAALPDAGRFDDEDLYDYDTDRYMRGRLVVGCPHCGRHHRPLLSPSVAIVEFGWCWVGLDDREPYSEKIARCARTRRWYRFTTYTPQ